MAYLYKKICSSARCLNFVSASYTDGLCDQCYKNPVYRANMETIANPRHVIEREVQEDVQDVDFSE